MVCSYKRLEAKSDVLVPILHIVGKLRSVKFAVQRGGGGGGGGLLILSQFS